MIQQKNYKISYKINKKLMTLTCLALMMLSFLNIITFGILKDRLLYQGERVVDLFIKTIEIE